MFTKDYSEDNYHIGDIVIFTNMGDGTVVISEQYKNEMMAFRFGNSIDIGVKVKEEEFLDKSLNEATVNSKIKIFNCFEKRCEATKGFLKYLDSTSDSIKIAECNENCETSTEKDCTKGDIAIFYTNEQPFVYCAYTSYSNNSPTLIESIGEPWKFTVPMSSGDSSRSYLVMSDANANLIGFVRSKKINSS